MTKDAIIGASLLTLVVISVSVGARAKFGLATPTPQTSRVDQYGDQVRPDGFTQGEVDLATEVTPQIAAGIGLQGAPKTVLVAAYDGVEGDRIVFFCVQGQYNAQQVCPMFTIEHVAGFPDSWQPVLTPNQDGPSNLYLVTTHGK